MANRPLRDEPEDDTLDLIYREVEVQLERQFDQITALNGRAQQLLTWAAGVLALIVGLRPPTEDVLVSVLFGGAVLIFIVLMVCGYLAWSIQGWRRDPEPGRLWEGYRLWPARWLKQQILLNWLKSWAVNRMTIDEKVDWVRRTQILLGVQVSYLVILLIVRPYIT